MQQRLSDERTFATFIDHAS